MHRRAFLLLVLLLLLSFPACQQAANSPVPSPLPSDPPVPSPQPAATNTEHVVILSTATPAQWNEIEVINDLKTKIQSNIPISGWLLQTIQREHLGVRAFVPSLPDGSPLPNVYVQETWYHLDRQKQVDQYIEFTKSVDGSVLATVIYTNGTMYTPYLEQPKEQAPFSMGDFDGEMLDRMAPPAGNNTYKVEQIELDGKPVMCLTAFEEYGAEIPGYAKIVQTVAAENCYDQETGWLAQEEGWYIFADGTEEVRVKAKWETHTNVTPPPEVLRQIESAEQ